ncbi:hypothetical protein HanRHA438_Chr05g0211471 [Helianthus annuus]|nr:hypothetical protein HanIR_Chr05g0217561 [Helianthus annuus]KAJ0917909.1 hypothetical protein HanRHA438_Chr05g0211471 [Helianthus annuus]
MRMAIIVNFIFYAIVNLMYSTSKWLKHIVHFHLKELVGKLNDFRLSFGLFFIMDLLLNYLLICNHAFLD